MDDATRTQIEAAAFRRLLQHLMHDRPDAQNIDMMNLAGFCRDTSSQAPASGLEIPLEVW